MGFWHTGYIEFHEFSGLDREWKPSPPRIQCSRCGVMFDSEGELRQHRFEIHPLHRPTVFLDGQEIGNQRVMITRPVAPEQLDIKGADRAILNDREVPLAKLGTVIAQHFDDVCRITLTKDGVASHFELEIRIASAEDLQGVEAQFDRMAATRRLDIRVVDEFIAASSPFKSAIGYCDGVCSYLYGLMAKERAADCSLKHEQYMGKYSAAAKQLAPYDRKLAHTIGGLIEFHFNHFRDVAHRCPDSRLGRVSGRFATWIDSRNTAHTATVDASHRRATSIERVVTEMDTERILDWATRPLESLVGDVSDIDEMCHRPDVEEFDRVKLHMLLGETLFATGNRTAALAHARTLRNVPAVDVWAESLIREIGEQA